MLTADLQPGDGRVDAVGMDGLIVVLAWLVVVPPVVTLIHELGHASAALALGRRVDMLAVGHHDDVTVTVGRTVLRFGRSLEGKPSGFVTLDPESSPDVGNLIPRGSVDTMLSDGRLILFAWAVHRGRPLPEVRPEPPAEPEPEPGPVPRTRWPFLAGLALVVVVTLLVGGPWLAAPVILLFGYVYRTGGHRTKAF